jgi:hypothetical protein
MGTQRIAKAPRAALLIAAVAAAASLSVAGCGSRTPDFVGSWTAVSGCDLTGFTRAEFTADGGVRAAVPTTLVDGAYVRKRYGEAEGAARCAYVLANAMPANGTWREDGPRLDVDLNGVHLVFYHRVADGRLTLAKDAGFRDDPQSYEAAK